MILVGMTYKQFFTRISFFCQLAILCVHNDVIFLTRHTWGQDSLEFYEEGADLRNAFTNWIQTEYIGKIPSTMTKAELKTLYNNTFYVRATKRRKVTHVKGLSVVFLRYWALSKKLVRIYSEILGIVFNALRKYLLRNTLWLIYFTIIHVQCGNHFLRSGWCPIYSNTVIVLYNKICADFFVPTYMYTICIYVHM